MAHNLCIEHGKAKLFYCGEVPWHGLGQSLAGPATSEAAIQAAGLDWEVEKVPLALRVGNRHHPIPFKMPWIPHPEAFPFRCASQAPGCRSR